MAHPGWVRVIGGRFRGRKLKVPAILSVRPTPDRVRETVFNWLAPYIHGARCLDLYAGSGALGFEALSRGAAFVVMVDEAVPVVKLLKEELALFKATEAEVISVKAPFGFRSTEPFDIVFLDPPFKANLLLPSCFYLEENNFLAKEAFIYLESEENITEKELPSTWQLIKSKTAGQVKYHLAKRIGQT